MNRIMGFAAAGLVMLLAAGTISPGAAMPADAQRPDNRASVRIGREVARHHCARCHAIGRQGQSPNRAAPRFPLIAERYPGANPAPDLVDGIVVRHPGMPEFILSDQETDGLIAYIRSVARRRPAGQSR